MSKEIIEEDDIYEFKVISGKEDHEGYILINTLIIEN